MNVRWIERQAKKRAQRLRPFSEIVAKSLRDAASAERSRLTEAAREAKFRARILGLPLELRCEILKHVEWTTVDLFKEDRCREAMAKYFTERPVGLGLTYWRYPFFEIWPNGRIGVFYSDGGWCKFKNKNGAQYTGPQRPMCWKEMIAFLSPNCTSVTVNDISYDCTPVDFEAIVTKALDRVTRFT